jgi:hypothetical protein
MKRIMVGLLTAGLVVAMLPGVAVAGGPPKDQVTGSALFRGYWLGYHVWVSAHSDADGSVPRGRIALEQLADGSKFTADVMCLDVDGNTAAIGAEIVTSDWDPSFGFDEGSYIVQYVVDLGSPGAGIDRSVTVSVGKNPPTCDASKADATARLVVEQGDYVVKDRD